MIEIDGEGEICLAFEPSDCKSGKEKLVDSRAEISGELNSLACVVIT